MSEEARNLSSESGGPIPTGWSGLLETSKRFGAYSWLEQRLFQVLGAWAGDEADHNLAVMFDDHARRHSWHASVWFDRLPELSNVDSERLVRPPSPQLASLLDELVGLTDPLDRLVAAYEVVVTRLAVAYRREEERLDRVGDPSSRHWLGLVLQNLADEVLQASALLEADIRSDTDVDRVTSIRNKVEKTWLVSGGLTHLG